jgi:hypothetical protein
VIKEGERRERERRERIERRERREGFYADKSWCHSLHIPWVLGSLINCPSKGKKNGVWGKHLKSFAYERREEIT